MSLPWARFLTYIYAWLTDGVDSEARERIDKLAFDPPGGITKEAMAELPEWQPAAMGHDFMAQFGDRFEPPPGAEPVV
jgi:hypothetical protein